MAKPILIEQQVVPAAPDLPRLRAAGLCRSLAQGHLLSTRGSQNRALQPFSGMARESGHRSSPGRAGALAGVPRRRLPTGLCPLQSAAMHRRIISSGASSPPISPHVCAFISEKLAGRRFTPAPPCITRPSSTWMPQGRRPCVSLKDTGRWRNYCSIRMFAGIDRGTKCHQLWQLPPC